MFRSKYLIFVILFLFLSGSKALAQFKFNHRWEISVAGQYRDLQQYGFSELENQFDGLALLSLEQTVTNKRWAFEIRPELRVLNSPSLSTQKTDISRIALTDPSRAMDFHSQISPADDSTDSNWANVSDIEKINLRYQGDHLEVLAGRNPFNPSILRLSPIWNKFGKDIFYVGYPNFQFNPDISSLKWQTSNFWIQNVNVFGRGPEQTAYLLIMGLNFESLETQFLIGDWWKQQAVGGNISLSTEESLWKAEILYLESDKFQSPSHTQAAVGFERSWTESFSTVSEIIFNNLSDQVGDPQLISLGASPFSKLRSKYYFATQFDYQMTEFWLASFTPVLNLEDKSGILALSLRGNLSDNLEVSANGRFGFGNEEAEFSSRSVRLVDGRYLGYNDIASLMMKYFFQ